MQVKTVKYFSPQDFDEGSALHYALETNNGYLDVPAFLEMLLNNGADVMATWIRRPFEEDKFDRQTENILPLHIAVEMQYGPDKVNLSSLFYVGMIEFIYIFLS